MLHYTGLYVHIQEEIGEWARPEKSYKLVEISTQVMKV